MRGLLAYAALTLLQASDATREETPAVAVIYEIFGQVVTTPGAGEAARPARLFDWLRDGSTIRVEEGSRVALAFVTGSRYELFGVATAELMAEGFAEVDGEIEALSPIPPLPPRAALGGATFADTVLGGVVLRGSGPSWIYPRRGATTIARDTTLRFGGARASSGYRVVLEDESGAVLLHTVVKDQVVSLESGLLGEGRVYSWRVLALGEAGILGSAEGEFTTLDASSSSRRMRLHEELASSRDAYLLALLAETDLRLGLLWEGLGALRGVQGLLPDDSGLRERCEALEALLHEGWSR